MPSHAYHSSPSHSGTPQPSLQGIPANTVSESPPAPLGGLSSPAVLPPPRAAGTFLPPSTSCPAPRLHPAPLCFNSLLARVPTSGPQTSTSCHIGGGIRLEIKCLINVMHLNNHQTILLPPWSVEKLSSMKPVPGAKKRNFLPLISLIKMSD